METADRDEAREAVVEAARRVVETAYEYEYRTDGGGGSVMAIGDARVGRKNVSGWTRVMDLEKALTALDAPVRDPHPVEEPRLAAPEMFFGVPERWFESPHWRCANGHVSRVYLSSETRGDACLAGGCGELVWMTFPEDKDGDVIGADVFALRAQYRDRVAASGATTQATDIPSSVRERADGGDRLTGGQP